MHIMRLCMDCKKNHVSDPKHDFCEICWAAKKVIDDITPTDETFRRALYSAKIFTVYIMLYGVDYKIGFTNDLNSRILEIKQKYPENKLVYFREFTHETHARKFELWLKDLSERHLNKFITRFQDKLRRVDLV